MYGLPGPRFPLARGLNSRGMKLATPSPVPRFRIVGDFPPPLSHMPSCHAVTTADTFPIHTHLQEAITLLEEEVVINQLLLNFLGHASERVELALQLTLQTRQCARHLLFHLLVLGFGQAGIEGVALQGTTTAHSCRDDVLTLPSS